MKFEISLKYQEMFGTCATLSSSTLTAEELVNADQKAFDLYFGRISPSATRLKGEAIATNAIKDSTSLDYETQKSLKY